MGCWGQKKRKILPGIRTKQAAWMIVQRDLPSHHKPHESYNFNLGHTQAELLVGQLLVQIGVPITPKSPKPSGRLPCCTMAVFKIIEWDGKWLNSSEIPIWDSYFMLIYG